MVTIPTIDQISGTTVMNKMRSLIHAFINFATEIDSDLTVISTQSSNAYEIATETASNLALAVDDIETIEQNLSSNYYTKTEVDTIIDNYYTKTQVDTKLDAKISIANITYPLYYSSNVLGVQIDGTSIFLSNDGELKTHIYGGGSGITVNSAHQINFNVGRGLYVNSGYNDVNVKVDDETVKINGSSQLYIPIDNSTIKVDANTGLISADTSGPDWEVLTTDDWVTNIIDKVANNKWVFLKDVIFYLSNINISSYYFPKGFTASPTDNICLSGGCIINGSALSVMGYSIKLSDIFTDDNTTTIKYNMVRIQTTSNSYTQTYSTSSGEVNKKTVLSTSGAYLLVKN